MLLALLDLKFQNEPKSVFQAHPKTIKAAGAGLLVFALAVGIDFTFHSTHLSPTCSHLLSTTIMLCGSLSVASLASLLFPDTCRPLISHLPLAFAWQLAWAYPKVAGGSTRVSWSNSDKDIQSS